MVRAFIFAFLVSLFATAYSQNPLSVSSPESDNSVDAQLASFQIDERLEISLFADETMGIANPVCFEWDAHDRLWVLCTWAYPQIKPDERPDDKLIILEDTDNDGRADKTSVFMDGLNMPTGFALGHGGVYIAEGHDLIHVKDTDNDGKADSRELIFTGFGTGDTHQNINSFAWTPGGELLFCQGLHCFSHVQTPWGNRHLEEYGSWRLRPLRRQLNSYRRTSSGGNPWGYAFGKWGEIFIKSNSTGISEFVPSMVQTDHIADSFWGGAVSIGGTKIKSMIIEIVDSPHLPEDLQGDFLIAGYFARNIARLRPSTDGAGHKLETLDPILTSSHNSFRPVDLNIGPDGALYVADWFNPIIGHYQASLRHPDRDTSHGRIWRITAKDKPLLESPRLGEMEVDQLVSQLASPLSRTRQLAKLQLMDLPKDSVIPATKKWLETLDKTDSEYEHHLYEAIGVFESHEVVDTNLLDQLLAAKNPGARAYATRVAGRWHDRLEDPLKRLRGSAKDPHPRVRLETIVAVSDVPSAESIVIASQAADGFDDRFINYSLTLAVHGLANYWKPALVANELKFEKGSHLTRVIATFGGDDLMSIVRERLDDPNMITVLAGLGNSADAAKALELGSDRPEVVQALIKSARERKLKHPPEAAAILSGAVKNSNNAARTSIIELIAAWKMAGLSDALSTIATTDDEPTTVRLAAIRAISDIGKKSSKETLINLSGSESPELATAAISGLATVDINTAATKATDIFKSLDEKQIGNLLSGLLSRAEGAKALASAIDKKPVPIDTAKLIRRQLNTSGRSDPELSKSIDSIIGSASPIPEHSPELVAELAADAIAKGDAENGKRIFQLPLITCTACHEVDGIDGATGAMKGPNLSAVAAGLPVDLLVESVLWPARQIKEGYQATTITTKDGKIISGFSEGLQKGLLKVKNISTGEITSIRKADVQSELKTGSMMPPGLTASLTRQELLDLIKYLSTLKGTATK